jgi:hypothetical protein
MFFLCLGLGWSFCFLFFPLFWAGLWVLVLEFSLVLPCLILMLLILTNRPLSPLPSPSTCANVFQVSTRSGNDPVAYAYAYAYVHAHLLPGASTPSLADNVFSVFTNYDFAKHSMPATPLSLLSLICTASCDNLAGPFSATCFLLFISTTIPLLRDTCVDA